MARLTNRQQRFVDEYLIDLNATQAAIRAGYSVGTSKSIGQRLLTFDKVENAIAKATAERSRRTGISADRVIIELAKIAFCNIVDVANIDHATVQDDADRDDTAAIQSIKVKRIPTDDGDIVEREVKLYDKGKALEQLGRHLGLFNDKLRLDGGVSVVIHDDLED